jgi:hypothetical protein
LFLRNFPVGAQYSSSAEDLEFWILGCFVLAVFTRARSEPGCGFAATSATELRHRIHISFTKQGVHEKNRRKPLDSPPTSTTKEFGRVAALFRLQISTPHSICAQEGQDTPEAGHWFGSMFTRLRLGLTIDAYPRYLLLSLRSTMASTCLSPTVEDPLE